MHEEALVDKRKAIRLYKSLFDYLSQRKDGRQVIADFKADPDEGGAALAAYLGRQLPHDEALAQRLINALGDGDGQFATIVTGGQVEKIVNIARLGVLNLTVKRYFYLFTTAWQVVVFLTIIIVVLSAVAFGLWLNTQPAMMDGDFNIAVARFHETGRSASGVPVAPSVSQRIATFLSGQYDQSNFQDVQVAYDKISVINSAEEAKALAKRIRADVVIYGEITVIGDTALIAPKFYVDPSHQPNVSEVGGQHQLAAPINFAIEELLDPESTPVTDVQQRTAILVEFTKALVYLAADNLLLGRVAINDAIKQAGSYGDFEGKEVLYLFASEIARLQEEYEASSAYIEEAFRLNDSYGRAYIALANIYYNQGDLFTAIKYYEAAAAQKDQPFGAYLAEKAGLGVGNSCSLQYQYVRRSEQPEEAALVELANCALTHYQRVIDTFVQLPEPDQQLTAMTAEAYYGSAVIYQESGDCAKARLSLEQTLNLTESERLRKRAERRLGEVTQC